MENGNEIVQTEFARLPKLVPGTDDWATVDVGVGTRRVVVIGHARNGTSVHEFGPASVRLESMGSDERRLDVELRIEEREIGENELIMGGPGTYCYRLAVTFADHLPDRFRIRHRDEDGNLQFDREEVLAETPETYDPARYVEG